MKVTRAWKCTSQHVVRRYNLISDTGTVYYLTEYDDGTTGFMQQYLIKSGIATRACRSVSLKAAALVTVKGFKESEAELQAVRCNQLQTE